MLPGRAAQLLAAVSASLATKVQTVQKRAHGCSVRDRIPWTALTPAEKTAYINADLCLMSLPSKLGVDGAVTRWDDLQWPHIEQAGWVHEVGAFLPFHRYYITVHERLTRDECGYTGPMPYWDELAELADLVGSELWQEQYFGGDGTGPGGCVEKGPFANLKLHFTRKGLRDQCLTRAFNQSLFDGNAQTNIDRCNAISDFKSATICLEFWPHISGHGGVGGIMIDGTYSPLDPVFFLHHSYLDMLWWEWQQLGEARRSDMGGPNTKGYPGDLTYPPPEHLNYFGDGGNTTTLNHTLFVHGLAPNVTIADVMDMNGPVICSNYVRI